jgi:TonB family protein
MKRQLFPAALLIAAAATLLAASGPAPNQLLAAPEQQAHIFGDRAEPLQLEVDFVAQMNVPIHGHISIHWQSKNRWWSKAVMGDFQQITMQNGEKIYTVENRPAPIRIVELTRLLHFAHAPEELTVKKVKERIQNGTALACLQIEWQKVKGESHEVCVNPDSHEIASDAWQSPPDEQRRELFSNYVDFHGYRYPRNLELQVNGSSVIAATVDTLKAAPLDENLLVPPQGAIERRQCAGMVHAKPLKTPDPAYPRSDSQNHVIGDTMVAMTILADGSVTGIRLIGAATHSMDDATLATLKTWKFKPAMCGSEPVVSDVQAVVSFRLKQ